ncbi:hypothetical protein [Blastococcus haudaquaticus]|uniref:Uncharacterized protein n=1 Tax=Blastococcus haudaquaticus TaxID=1938745 RepID=A0A286GZT8_9ACTN|nr:hypothetical protein [Blastococcus haudaquaticus]SOE00716.1 hypothetical protein SAMN06272739_2749 [Blastococcus haudaquaticus]
MRIRLALALALAAPLLGACGASEDEQRKAAFCDDVPTLMQEVTADLNEVPSDPMSANEALDDAVAQLEEVEPPEDVADEWSRLETAWSDMRDLIGRADLSDPAANAELAPELQRLQPELVEAGTAIDDWGKENC